MTQTDEIKNLYFDWMENMVSEGRFAEGNTYHKLLMHLHDTEFTYLMDRDVNRAHDGMDLRYRFACLQPGIPEVYLEYLDGPCSVLEMMLALAIRCEESIMDDPRYGDRTAQWFWNMVVSLGLGSMNDTNYSKQYVKKVLTIFLRREYAYNGRGGLFTVRKTTRDLREVEIWAQLNWYLNGIV